MTCNDTTSVLRLVEDEEALVDEDGVSLSVFLFFLWWGDKEAGEKGGNEPVGNLEDHPS